MLLYEHTIFKRRFRKHIITIKKADNLYELSYKGKKEYNFTLYFNKDLAFTEYNFLVDTIDKIKSNKDIDNFIKAFKQDYSF